MKSKRNTQPWCLLASETFANNHSGQNYLVLPSKTNPRWILPLYNATVAVNGLELYCPSTLIGNLYRFLMKGLAYFGPFIKKNQVRLDATSTTALSKYIDEITSFADGNYMAISCGTDWARSKTTLKVMNAEGETRFYIKVGQHNLARQALQREAHLLSVLSTTRLVKTNSIPRLIAITEKDENLVLVQGPGPVLRSSNLLKASHWTFLEALLKDARLKFPSEFLVLRNLDIRIKVHEKLLTAAEAETLSRSLKFLRATDDVLISYCIEHGDFAPWNIRVHPRNKSGEIFVFDWEQGTEWGVPMFDALHFVFQVHCLLHKATTKELLRELDAVTSGRHSQQYMGRACLDASNLHVLKVAYLLTVIVDALEIGEVPKNSMLQKARFTCLDMLNAGTV